MMSYPTLETAEVEFVICEACDGSGTYEDEIHMHALVRIIRRDCDACDGNGFIEIEEEAA